MSKPDADVDFSTLDVLRMNNKELDFVKSVGYQLTAGNFVFMTAYRKHDLKPKILLCINRDPDGYYPVAVMDPKDKLRDSHYPCYLNIKEEDEEKTVPTMAVIIKQFMEGGLREMEPVDQNTQSVEPEKKNDTPDTLEAFSGSIEDFLKENFGPNITIHRIDLNDLEDGDKSND